VLTDLLDDVPVSRLMRHDPVVVYPELSLATLVDEYLMAGADRAFPVVDGDRLIGMVTAEDVRNIRREDWTTMRVRQVMTPSSRLAVATMDEPTAAALAKLAERDVEQLPVVGADESLLGVIRRRDILRWLELQPRAGGARLRERHV
jgi:CBS domain-containing protein